MPDVTLPKAICVNCVVRMNSCLDAQRGIIRNMYNHRIRYYHTRGDRETVLRLQRECAAYKTNCMKLPGGLTTSFFTEPVVTRVVCNPNVPRTRTLPGRIVNNDAAGLIISDVRTEELPQEPDSTGDEIDDTDATPHTSEIGEASTSASAELLEPMFQTSENANETESGGNIHVQNEALSARRKKNDPISYKCPHCNKVYRQAAAWRRHIRTHQGADQRKSINQKPKFKCPNCTQEFESLAVLNKHSILHAPKFVCEDCHHSTTLEYVHSWHRVQCAAESLALNVTVADTPNRRTRSQGRPDKPASVAGRDGAPTRRAATNEDDNTSRSSHSSLHSTQSDSMYDERIAVVQMWAKQLEIGDKPDPKDLTSGNKRDDDAVSVRSDISGMTRLSNVSYDSSGKSSASTASR